MSTFPEYCAYRDRIEDEQRRHIRELLKTIEEQRDAIWWLRSQLATHKCTICGAFWKLWEPGEAQPGDDGSWTLYSPIAGKCCDNEPMDRPNIVPANLSAKMQAAVSELIAERDAARSGAPECRGGSRRPHGKCDDLQWLRAELGKAEAALRGMVSCAEGGNVPGLCSCGALEAARQVLELSR